VPQQQQKAEAPKPEKMEISKNVDIRKELIADVTRTDLVPKEISARRAMCRRFARRSDDAG